MAMLVACAATASAACGERVTVGVIDKTAEPGADSAPPPFTESDASPPGPDADAPDAASATPGCATKECGAICLPCDDDASTCAKPAVFHACSAEGNCRPSQPQCIIIQQVDASASSGSGGYVPCAGLACGAKCTSCDPVMDAACTLPVEGVCLADGTCAAGPSSCP